MFSFFITNAKPNLVNQYDNNKKIFNIYRRK